MTNEKRKRLIELMDEIDGFIIGEDEGKQETEKNECKEICAEEIQKDKGAWRTGNQEGWTGPNRNKKKRYTPAFKKMIVGLHRDAGYSFERLTMQYGVSKASVTHWCSEERYMRKLDENIAQEELAEMQKKCESLVQENEILKRTIQTLSMIGITGGIA